nr:OBP1 [Megoura viciae]
MTRDEFEDMLTSPNARELTILKSHAHKCMFGCVMRKNHIVNDGVVSKEVLSKYVLNFYGRPDYKRRLIIKDVEHIVDVCAKKVADESETDECELAATLVTCIVLEANKAGLVDDPARQI